MERIKGKNPLEAFRGPRAELLQGFGIGAARKQKKPGEARPFFPSGSTPFRTPPQGGYGSEGRENWSHDSSSRCKLTHRAQGFTYTRKG
jgi:hypothetical protein